MKISQRANLMTAPQYKGIPINAMEGCHEKVSQLVVDNVANKRDLILDIGAGNGALSKRLIDLGYSVLPFELDTSEWMLDSVECIEADIDAENIFEYLSEGQKVGAICLVEVIEHLENPRAMISKLVDIASKFQCPIIITTPNMLDTFSCLTMFKRGILNWFSPTYYQTTGHISILPYWLINKHFEYFGVDDVTWSFVAPHKYKSLFPSMLYWFFSMVRKIISKDDLTDLYADGQCAICLVKVKDKE